MKHFSKIVLIALSCILLTFPAFASDVDSIATIPSASNRSCDDSFVLDFSTSSSWRFDFDNNALAFLNHRYVTVDYVSCIPSNSSAKVKIVLYIDDDEDGVYEIYDSTGGYTFQLTVGDSIRIALPYGNTVKNYRLLFTNQSPSVTSGNFNVETSRS